MNTRIADHLRGFEDDPEAYEGLIEGDVIAIGKENKPIDKADLKNFLNKLFRWQNFMSKFNQGRSHIFEGIYKLPAWRDSDYEIGWGS